MREGIAITAFTQQGRKLAESLRTKIGDKQEPVLIRSARTSLRQWAEEQFPVRWALVFIGAAGIAVRAIAPFLKSKADDPAVIVMDEAGHLSYPWYPGIWEEPMNWPCRSRSAPGQNRSLQRLRI